MANILVIDNDKLMLQLIKRMLEKDWHCVSLQEKSTEVAKMDLRLYDLILLDIMMPEIDGFDVCKQIRDWVDCPIIFLSAKMQEMDIVQGLALGGDDYITKPFGMNEFE